MPHFKNQTLPLILALIVAESLTLLLVPMETLITYVVADDYFYYLTLAKNSLAGVGPSFDGQELTNGFHPLWFLLLRGLLVLVHSPDLQIRIGLIFIVFVYNLIGLTLLCFSKNHLPSLA